MLENFLSILGALTGLASLWLSNEQWKKIKAKIGMLSDAGKAVEILPAWYTSRMMQDQWYFGLVTTDGNTIAIGKITAISDDGKWMDVELLTADEVPNEKGTKFITAVADDRRSASIQIEKIVMAYEIVTS
ncbi:hypothetical protein LH435_15430 [Laribacter hongkongensis]|uniref:hypothetical protein n=1 Tax=Laribacter hongkongensis TaxID=168471 RepID=UPI001EFE60CA|nr:hypothetical protein [Laribacter hongkongensis]MCG8995105.1 hypothetical protein [Laribacter hongkongensis]MCG9011915.1 hypothetical protein [Laribacter hongkongensis]MCG9048427.1 hypothetical protein [Laribacter hongkongensis]MCG9075359.1 hypothetical protein [Laribacter hongkongensis]